MCSSDLEFGVFLPEAAARESASRMLGMSADDLGPEELESVAGEIGNLLTGRLHAHFRERSLASVVGLPKLARGGALPRITPEAGLFERFMLPGAGDFVVSLLVRDLLEEGNAVASATPEAAPA